MLKAPAVGLSGILLRKDSGQAGVTHNGIILMNSLVSHHLLIKLLSKQTMISSEIRTAFRPYSSGIHNWSLRDPDRGWRWVRIDADIAHFVSRRRPAISDFDIAGGSFFQCPFRFRRVCTHEADRLQIRRNTRCGNHSGCRHRCIAHVCDPKKPVRYYFRYNAGIAEHTDDLSASKP